MAADQWVQWNGNWYYLNSDGSMAKDTVVTVGYRIGEDGVWRPNYQIGIWPPGKQILPGSFCFPVYFTRLNVYFSDGICEISK